MKLAGVLNKKSIRLDLEIQGKREILMELASLAAETGKVGDKKQIFKTLIEREKLGSTALEPGVAIPHGRLKDIDEFVLIIAKTKEPLDFESTDGKPTQLFFMLIGPEDKPGPYLKILARISRILKNSETRGKLLELKNPTDIYDYLKTLDDASSIG